MPIWLMCLDGCRRIKISSLMICYLMFGSLFNRGWSDAYAQIKKIGVYKQEFIDANTSKISPNDRRGYDEIFESWQPMLKDPNQVKNFKIVQDLLERKRQN